MNFNYEQLLAEIGATTQAEAIRWIHDQHKLNRKAAARDLSATVIWAREEFADKEHVARCRGQTGLADYYKGCKDHMDRALEASRQ